MADTGVLSAPGAGKVQTGPLPDDVNGDGKVDCTGVHIVGASYGRAKGQAGFNPRAGESGRGGQYDLAFVLRQSPPGQKCH